MPLTLERSYPLVVRCQCDPFRVGAIRSWFAFPGALPSAIQIDPLRGSNAKRGQHEIQNIHVHHCNDPIRCAGDPAWVRRPGRRGASQQSKAPPLTSSSTLARSPGLRVTLTPRPSLAATTNKRKGDDRRRCGDGDFYYVDQQPGDLRRIRRRRSIRQSRT